MFSLAHRNVYSGAGDLRFVDTQYHLQCRDRIPGRRKRLAIVFDRIDEIQNRPLVTDDLEILIFDAI